MLNLYHGSEEGLCRGSSSLPLQSICFHSCSSTTPRHARLISARLCESLGDNVDFMDATIVR